MPYIEAFDCELYPREALERHIDSVEGTFDSRCVGTPLESLRSSEGQLGSETFPAIVGNTERAPCDSPRGRSIWLRLGRLINEDMRTVPIGQTSATALTPLVVGSAHSPNQRLLFRVHPAG